MIIRTQFYANSVDFIEITLLAEALAVLPSSAGLAFAVLPARWPLASSMPVPYRGSFESSIGLIPDWM